MTQPSVVESVGARRIMDWLLADKVIKSGLTNCANPAHPDKNPSMSVNLDSGVFNCFSCGVHGGVLDLAVLRGHGRDHAEAAKFLAERFNVSPTTNGHAPPARPWPYYPKTAAALGWELDPTAFGEHPGLRVPTWLADGKPGRTKYRGPRVEDKVLSRFENDSDEIGLINLPALIDHCAGAQAPHVALVAGETDLLAWTFACRSEGLDIPAVSIATGEGTVLRDEFLRHFSGATVYVAYDNDQQGKSGGEKNAAKLASVAASARYLPPPAPHKDLRDYVEAGGKIRDLVATEPVKKPFTSKGAFDLLRTELPKIEELVAGRVIYRGGVTVLVSSHKRGKSLAALALCADLVLNLTNPDLPPGEMGTWLGQNIVAGGPCLVYSAEGGERMIQERIAKMARNPGEWLNNLRIYAERPTPRLDRKEDLDRIFEHAEEVGAVLIVFDPLGRFWAMEDEADPTTARNLMEAIQTHAEAAYGGRGIAVLIVHHDTKGGSASDTAVTGGRGSGKFGDDADALINLKLVNKGEAGESEAQFLLRHAESPKPVRVKIDTKTLRLRKEDEKDRPPLEKKKGPQPKLSLDNLEKLVKHYKRIACKRVPEELGVSYGTWKNNRKDMIRDLCDGGQFMHDSHTDELVLMVGDQPADPGHGGHGG